MFPIRCIQPPCMNIDVSGVYHADSPRTHTTFSATGKRAPGGAVCSSSPGISPSRQTELDSSGSLPKPCSNAHASTLATMSP
jgi:hypothetical protein